VQGRGDGEASSGAGIRENSSNIKGGFALTTQKGPRPAAPSVAEFFGFDEI